jgi:hypothetical protein
MSTPPSELGGDQPAGITGGETIEEARRDVERRRRKQQDASPQPAEEVSEELADQGAPTAADVQAAAEVEARARRNQARARRAEVLSGQQRPGSTSLTQTTGTDTSVRESGQQSAPSPTPGATTRTVGLEETTQRALQQTVLREQAEEAEQEALAEAAVQRPTELRETTTRELAGTIQRQQVRQARNQALIQQARDDPTNLAATTEREIAATVARQDAETAALARDVSDQPTALRETTGRALGMTAARTFQERGEGTQQQDLDAEAPSDGAGVQTGATRAPDVGDTDATTDREFMSAPTSGREGEVGPITAAGVADVLLGRIDEIAQRVEADDKVLKELTTGGFLSETDEQKLASAAGDIRGGISGAVDFAVPGFIPGEKGIESYGTGLINTVNPAGLALAVESGAEFAEGSAETLGRGQLVPLAEAYTVTGRESAEAGFEMVTTDPAGAAGAATGGIITGFAAGKAIERGARAVRSARVRANTDVTIDAEDLTSPGVREGETRLPTFSRRAQSDTGEAIAEFRERLRSETPDVIAEQLDESLAFHGTESELPRSRFQALSGESELPGLFVSADLSPLRLPFGDDGPSSFRPRLPKLFDDSMAAGIVNPDVDALPDDLSLSGAREFLEQQADEGVAFVRGQQIRTSEQEAIFPPGTSFVEDPTRVALRTDEGLVPLRFYRTERSGDVDVDVDLDRRRRRERRLSASEVPRSRIDSRRGQPFAPPAAGGGVSRARTQLEREIEARRRELRQEAFSQTTGGTSDGFDQERVQETVDELETSPRLPDTPQFGMGSTIGGRPMDDSTTTTGPSVPSFGFGGTTPSGTDGSGPSDILGPSGPTTPISTPSTPGFGIGSPGSPTSPPSSPGTPTGTPGTPTTPPGGGEPPTTTTRPRDFDMPKQKRKRDESAGAFGFGEEQFEAQLGSIGFGGGDLINSNRGSGSGTDGSLL